MGWLWASFRGRARQAPPRQNRLAPSKCISATQDEVSLSARISVMKDSEPMAMVHSKFHGTLSYFFLEISVLDAASKIQYMLPSSQQNVEPSRNSDGSPHFSFVCYSSRHALKISTEV